MTGEPQARLDVLIVSYFFPPQNIIGARRPHALAKHLRRQRHHVSVLTSVRTGRGAEPDADVLVRARDALDTRMNWRRDSMEVITGGASQQGTWTPGFNLWGAIFLPDVQLLSWVPFALAAAGRMGRRQRPDVVITTSPTESTHLVGLALKRRGVPWIADLRDGWRFEHPSEDYPFTFQRRLDAALEGTVVRAADAVVTVTEPLSADLRARYGIPVHTLTNGFDPDDLRPAGNAPPLVSPDKLSIVHTGGLGHERTIRPVLEALHRLQQDDAGLPGRIEVVLAGARTAAEVALYDDPRFAPFVRHVGFVERDRALALQREADVLLLVTSGKRTGEATGKLFEYLGSGRPIIVLGDASAAAGIVREAAAGWAIPTGDSDEAEAVLRRLLAGERPDGDGADRERYGYPSIVRRYAELIAEVVA